MSWQEWVAVLEKLTGCFQDNENNWKRWLRGDTPQEAAGVKA